MRLRKKEAIVLDTNMPMYYGDKLSQLKKRGREIFIPWMVNIEMGFMYRRAITAAESKEREEDNNNHNQKNKNPYEKRMQEQRQRIAKKMYPIVQEKIETGEWKLIGKNADTGIYFNSIREEIIVGAPDDRVLATCLFIADTMNFKRVVLMTRDKRLKKKAIKYGLEVEEKLVD